MRAEKLREEILELVKNADAKLLKMFAALSEVYEEAESDDFWGELDKTQRDEVIRELEQGEKDIAEGKVYTIEEAREVVKKW